MDTNTSRDSTKRLKMTDDLRTFLVMYENGDMILMHKITHSDIREICQEMAKDSNPMVSFTDVTDNSWISMFPNSIKGKL